MLRQLPTQARDIEAPSVPSFDEVYDEYVDFVWRVLRRLGVPASSIPDAAQEVFVVVARRLAHFEGRSSLRSWIAGIAVLVARREYRTRLRRDRAALTGLSSGDPDMLADGSRPTPLEAALVRDLVRQLYRMLDRLSPDHREVFVLTELEEMTAVEIAGVLGIPLNTVYSRLRAARSQFDHILSLAAPGAPPRRSQ